jgi:hypothetical protein
VTRPGRAERQIGREITLDQAAYGTHPDVENLVAVVFDLYGTFTNAVGFERDLSGGRNGLATRVAVVPWPAATR